MKRVAKPASSISALAAGEGKVRRPGTRCPLSRSPGLCPASEPRSGQRKPGSIDLSAGPAPPRLMETSAQWIPAFAGMTQVRPLKGRIHRYRAGAETRHGMPAPPIGSDQVGGRLSPRQRRRRWRIPPVRSLCSRPHDALRLDPTDSHISRGSAAGHSSPLSHRERADGIGVAGRGTRPRRLRRQGEGRPLSGEASFPHPVSARLPPEQVRGSPTETALSHRRGGGGFGALGSWRAEMCECRRARPEGSGRDQGGSGRTLAYRSFLIPGARAESVLIESGPLLQLFDSSRFPGGKVRTLFLKMR